MADHAANPRQPQTGSVIDDLQATIWSMIAPSMSCRWFAHGRAKTTSADQMRSVRTPPTVAATPDPETPPRTFGDLEARGLEMQVACQKCGHQLVIDTAAKGLRERRLAGARFRCQEILPDGAVCRGIGLPSIGKERRWARRLAEHARQLRQRR